MKQQRGEESEQFAAINDCPFVKLDDLYRAYYECRKHKRRTSNAIAFELDFERNLIDLWREINSGEYQISRSIAFTVDYPVKREVFAADFRDRVVHHLIIDKINHLLEAEFIPDSYSCREGKGTLFGAKRVQQMLARCSSEGKEDCYILKLDIRSFFMSIYKPLLYQKLEDFLQAKYQGDDLAIILSLIRMTIFNNPDESCRIKGSLRDWDGLPHHKSLFWAERERGLPIGNLTSQIFANFYLNGLDKFVTQTLGIRYYGRYVDDFVLIHKDKSFLQEAHRKIAEFLDSELKLSLHPQKVYLQHYSKGVRFIGAVIKYDHIIIGRRTKGNLYNKIYGLLPIMAQSAGKTLEMLPCFNSSINSYLGLMRHYKTYHLRGHILRLLSSTFLAPALEKVADNSRLKVAKIFMPKEQTKHKLRRQRQYRRHYHQRKEKKYGSV